MTDVNENGQEPITPILNVPNSDVGAVREPPSPEVEIDQGSGPVPAWVSDPAAAYAEIQKLRDEAGRHRTRANQLEAELETAAFDAAERSQALDSLRATV